MIPTDDCKEPEVVFVANLNVVPKTTPMKQCDSLKNKYEAKDWGRSLSAKKVFVYLHSNAKPAMSAWAQV